MAIVISIILGILVGYIVNLYNEFENSKEKPYKWYLEIFYKKIKYLVVELATIIMFIIAFYKVGTINSLYFEYIFILSIILAATLVDIRIKKIPNKIILIGFFGLSVFILINFSAIYIISSMIGIVVTLIILTPISIISKGSFGMGDVKLYSLSGGFLGVNGLLSCLFFSTMLAAITGMILIFIKKVEKKTTMPLAPFILLGTVITIIFI
ncbi:MAG: A24 family peptidase [Clostridiales bacterium]